MYRIAKQTARYFGSAIRFKRWRKLIPVLCLFLLCLSLLTNCQQSYEIQAISEPSLPPPTLEEEALAPAPKPIVAMPSQVNRDRLEADLFALSVERYTGRQKQTARDYIKQHLDPNYWTIEEQPLPGGINLIARQKNRDRQAGELLLGAHYDTIRGTPGADDNATGVAALLELGRIFQAYPAPKALSLAFFDLEEAGAVGSSAFTNIPQNLEYLDGVIILEMIGYTCETPNCQDIPPELDVEPPSNQGDFLSIIGDQENVFLLDAFEHQKNSDLPLFSLPVPFKGLLTPILLRSDHAPFWLKGIGAVMVSDTAFLRNPHYHRSSDTASTLDIDFFTRSTDLVARATAELLHQPLS